MGDGRHQVRSNFPPSVVVGKATTGSQAQRNGFAAEGLAPLGSARQRVRMESHPDPGLRNVSARRFTVRYWLSRRPYGDVASQARRDRVRVQGCNGGE